MQEPDGSNPPSPPANLLTGLNIDEYFTRTDSTGAAGRWVCSEKIFFRRKPSL
jgi:hypothetical protein